MPIIPAKNHIKTINYREYEDHFSLLYDIIDSLSKKKDGERWASKEEIVKEWASLLVIDPVSFLKKRSSLHKSLKT